MPTPTPEHRPAPAHTAGAPGEASSAHLWLPDAGRAGGWAFVPLDAEATVLDGATLLLRPGCPPDGDVWLLVAPPSTRVNGTPLDAGIRVLRDRDELCAAGMRVFFSTERLAVIEPFPGDRPVCCPRCKVPIAPGSPAVRCPRCGVWHHQTDELPCWTYGERCTLCDQPTALDAGFRWTPEDL